MTDSKNIQALNSIKIRISGKAKGNLNAINTLASHLTNLILSGKYRNEKTTIHFFPSSLIIHDHVIAQQALSTRIRSMEVFSLCIRKNQSRQKMEEELTDFFSHVLDNNREELDNLLSSSQVFYDVAREEHKLSPAEIGLPQPQDRPPIQMVDFSATTESDLEDLYPLKREALPPKIQGVLAEIDETEQDKKYYRESIEKHLREFCYGDFSLNKRSVKHLIKRRNISSKILEMINIHQKKDNEGKRIFNISQALSLVSSKSPHLSLASATRLVKLKDDDGNSIFNSSQAVKIATSSKPKDAEKTAARLVEKDDDGNTLFNSAQAVQIAVSSDPKDAEETATRLVKDDHGNRIFNSAQVVKIATSSKPKDAEETATRLVKLKDDHENSIFNSSQAVTIAVSSNPKDAEETATRLVKLKDDHGSSIFNSPQAVQIATSSKPKDAEETATRLVKLKDDHGSSIFNSSQAVAIAVSSNPKVTEETVLKLLQEKDRNGKPKYAVTIAIREAISQNHGRV